MRLFRPGDSGAFFGTDWSYRRPPTAPDLSWAFSPWEPPRAAASEPGSEKPPPAPPIGEGRTATCAQGSALQGGIRTTLTTTRKNLNIIMLTKRSQTEKDKTPAQFYLYEVLENVQDSTVMESRPVGMGKQGEVTKGQETLRDGGHSGWVSGCTHVETHQTAQIRTVQCIHLHKGVRKKETQKRRYSPGSKISPWAVTPAFLGAGDFSPNSSQPFDNFLTSPFYPTQLVLLFCCCLSHTVFFCLVSCNQTYCFGSSPLSGTCSPNSVSLCHLPALPGELKAPVLCGLGRGCLCWGP